MPLIEMVLRGNVTYTCQMVGFSTYLYLAVIFKNCVKIKIKRGKQKHDQYCEQVYTHYALYCTHRCMSGCVYGETRYTTGN